MTAHRLPARVELDSQLAAFIGLLRSRNTPATSWSEAGRDLGQLLLSGPRGALPSSVARLVVVADGVLHPLPFEALYAHGDTRSIGERYEIISAPSATFWLRLRNAPTEKRRNVLVFADPDVQRGSPDEGQQLEPLPWARREAESLQRLLPLHATVIHAGTAATERRLKESRLDSIRVLHLAAHARADDAFPGRSAVFLAPGDDREDGWLQPPEIAALDLRGAFVVLSACESADGAFLSGEGPLSLARAFFAAGATSVVATRWPLRDDDAAYMMERLYRALAGGATLVAKLRQARLDAISSGRSAAAWAGVALLGDGGRPLARPPAVSLQRWVLGVGGSIALVIALARIARRGRQRRNGLVSTFTRK